MSMPLKKPEGISWNAASVELPEIPMHSAGPGRVELDDRGGASDTGRPAGGQRRDAAAKENMFSGKLGAAQAAYQTSDDARFAVRRPGSRHARPNGPAGRADGTDGGRTRAGGRRAPACSVTDPTGHAGGPGWQAEATSRLTGRIQRAAGQGAAAAAAGAPPAQVHRPVRAQRRHCRSAAARATTPPSRKPKRAKSFEPATGTSTRDREPLQRADDRPAPGAPDLTAKPGAGAAPVTPPEHPRHSGDDDIRRRL